MRFYPKPHQCYGGIDLHARTMYLCLLNQEGEVFLHQNMTAAPAPFLKAIAPCREEMVVCVECMFTWSWLADLCAQEGIPFVLGHALDMTAIHGGKAKNDQLAAHNMAVLLRGGMIPQAYVYPAARRATRDLRRRRRYLTRTRAELLTHVQQTKCQYNLSAIGKKIADQANRVGVAARFPEPAVPKRIDVELALIDHDAQRLRDLELAIVTTAKQHEANTLYVLQTGPGIGKILSLVLWYERHDITRFPRGQDFVSYGRVVTCAKASAGKRSGTSGTKIGNAYLTWACSEAAVLCLRNNPAGQQSLARLENTHGTGKAVTVLAHKRARAVYDMLNRGTAVDMDQVLRG